MQAAAMNAIFDALPTYALPNSTWIIIGDNPGFATCNKDDLILKGWHWYENDD